ncbi:unnamed protein product [Adineta ricciae]|nr:unnamed protein product [Adineta ricciae]
MAHVRGKGEYSRGVHKIQLKIENFNNGFFFFGINSKSTPIQNNSNTTPSSYGWLVGGNNAVYLHVNDIIELELDCYRRFIRMQNRRSGRQHELPIELDKCQFPWVLQLIFNYGTRIRIIP